MGSEKSEQKQLKDIVDDLPAAPVLKELESVYASLGSRVIFHCSFLLPKLIYSFAVWKFGNVIVNKDNDKFCIMDKAGDFLLYIPRLSLSMVGEVTCEIRYSIPQHRSVLINKTQAQLHVVPTIALRDLQLPFYHPSRRILPGRTLRQGDVQPAQSTAHCSTAPEEETRSNGGIPYKLYFITPVSAMGYPFYVTYCRFHDDHVYLHVTLNDMVITKHITVYHHDEAVGQGVTQPIVVFQWENFVYPVPVQLQYGVEIMDPLNNFVQLGVTRTPSVKVVGTQTEKIVKLRVQLLGAIYGMTLDSSIKVHLHQSYQTPTREQVPLGNWGTVQAHPNASPVAVASSVASVPMPVRRRTEDEKNDPAVNFNFNMDEGSDEEE